MTEMTMIEAVNRALDEALARDPDVVVLGQDVGVDGGIFRATLGLIEKYGANRVIDTPLAESGILGMALGMSFNGMKPVAEIQFSGFSYQAFHQLENHAARFRWRTRGRFPVPMVARMPYGAGVRALEHHSESREAYWAHTPGLKIVIPSGPRAARALLLAAIDDPDPVVFYEPKALYRGFREEVPDEPETMEIGRARIAREGRDITMIAYGAMLPRTLEAAERLSAEGVLAEVIDLLTLSPLDEATLLASAQKTGRVLVVHEAARSFGPGAEICARLNDKVFFSLEAPVKRVTGYDIHPPFFAREQYYLPSVARILDEARDTLSL
ncbi:MAG: alpha-ketoacid dehydrogenase subunit beta [Rhodothalassiaceae bacterium]